MCDCTNGYLLDQTYGYTFIPPDAVSVQRCDQCQRFVDDYVAARQAARDLKTAFGANVDPFSDEIATEMLDLSGNHLGPILTGAGLRALNELTEPPTGPGDAWVFLPTDHPLRERAPE